MLLSRIEILDYLNNAIHYWEKIDQNKKHKNHKWAVYYLDAFISVKESIFGKDKKEKQCTKNVIP